METESPLQLLARARETVAQVRRALEHPDPQTLDEAQPRLAQAIGNLTLFLETRTAGEEAAVSPAAVELQREVCQVRALLDALAGFRLGWMRRLFGMACSYNSQGLPVPAPAAPRIVVEG